MKRIVLSEGKNDVHLVSSFFKECDKTLEVKRFHGENLGPSLRGEESQEITNFQERRNPYDVLVKSENGKPNLKKIFSVLANRLMEIKPDVFVLIDLDGGRLDELVHELDERVQARHNGIKLGTAEVRERNGDMLAATCEVLTTTEKVKGEFHLVAFEQTLERVAGTSREEDREVQEEKIECLLDEDHVFDLLDSVLNGRID